VDTRRSHLRASILDAVRREPAATRRDVARQTASIVAVAIVVDVALFFLFGGVHRGPRPARFILITQGGACLVALAMLLGAFGRGRSMLGRSKRRLLWIAVATPILLLSWTLVWNTLYPEAVIAAPERIGLRCLAFSLAVAAWPLVLISRVRREKNPVAPIAAGAARGAAVGALAWVLVGLWCPLTNLPHLALGHFLPLLVLCGVGGWLGKRLMSVDSRAPSQLAPRG
jgi:hypothetical protein